MGYGDLKMTAKELFNTKNRPITITLIVLGVFVLALLVFQSTQPKQPTPVTTDQSQLTKLLARDTASANLIKATLTVYYIANNEYPVDYATLTSYVDNDQTGQWSASGKTNFDGIRKNLKDLSYTVRGDFQAYQFTYTDSAGKPVTVKGDYQNDYH